MTPRRKPKRNNNSFFTFLLVGFLLISSIYYISEPSLLEDSNYKNAEEVPISDITRGYSEEEYESIIIKDNEVFVKKKDGTFIKSYKEGLETVSNLGWNDPENPTIVNVQNTEAANLFIAILPDLLFFVLIIGGLFWLFRSIAKSQNTALGFGKSKARIADAQSVKTKFDNVAGCDEGKEELVEVVDFLKHPKKYADIGAKIPKGVLLVGAPGTGKTLLARAVAGEAKVPFFSISGSEFVEMFVGVGASRVRDLFNRAKRNSPCIIFIDEIDAVGRQRGGAGFGGGHDEREQTLNQILTEMDGFDNKANIVVMAATNRPDVLDKALLRPGRFDRRIFIDKPDLKAREQILEVHSKNKKLARGIKLGDVAKQTVGLTGADLENIMNESAIIAARRGGKAIRQKDVVDAVEKVTIGPERKSRKLTDHEKKITAYHELGHAIVGHMCKHSDPLHKISIVSRGGTLGVTWFLPEEDNYTTSKSKFIDEVCSLLGGRAAEELIFDETTTGASNDLERASQIVRDMATKYGMGPDNLGAVVYGEKEGTIFSGVDPSMNRNYSEETANTIDEFIRKTIGSQLERAKKMLEKNREKLDKLAKILLKKEAISLKEFTEEFTSS
ncbi:ATP-dependent zinc metalloprotease FtsH [Candidatus Peribacteria bacterium]|mgnify:CR=1 FL=1|jgi:cell division protease FtsH|nr:ATP-dependent zinc metalloprotease FtsH [Candidatus Peribacteria bacterium]MBT4020888.1 ATP-dependent zinc metalloprotease FtsH [Candidatus Peribacteria bacterium]MBT4240974.1 ATP-dependent zinc metalloprotease FtsH [Candidatus Peribacteria bacterium]MBT4473887.1 ATP-dependent zinc metalloprotease FtsH [Candidatus Peribacteria bacterium]